MSNKLDALEPKCLSDVLKPTDRLTRVLPTFRTSKIEGALMSYQSTSIISAYINVLVLNLSTFASEGVDDLFLDTLLTLRETFVL